LAALHDQCHAMHTAQHIPSSIPCHGHWPKCSERSRARFAEPELAQA
jgi:hypothetical protein